MKRLIIILILLIPFAVHAQKKGFKVVETVPEEQPKWVGAKENMDYIYVMGQEGTTLVDAKNAAIQCVLSDIAMSVAVNVVGDITDMSITNVEGNKIEFEETVVSNIKTKIAKLPAIQGITAQKADVFYKRFHNKKTGEEYFVLYLRYPFSEFERRDLIAAYNEMEKAINDKIFQYDQNVKNVSSLEEIKSSISALNDLKKELSDDDTRINQISSVITKYNDVCNSIVIDVVDNVPGKIVVRLVYNNRMIETLQKPKISSDCAEDFNSRYDENGSCVITFDSRYCYPQDLPTVDVSFRVGSKIQNKHIRIKF